MNRISIFFAALFGRLHVDAVLASVHSTIARLEAVAEHHLEQERRHLELEKEAVANKLRAAEEKVKASKLVIKIRALIS